MANMSALKIILVFSPLYSSKSKTAQRENIGLRREWQHVSQRAVISGLRSGQNGGEKFI
jgi:hypothetical protein